MRTCANCSISVSPTADPSGSASPANLPESNLWGALRSKWGALRSFFLPPCADYAKSIICESLVFSI